jgi:hypothetical protein
MFTELVYDVLLKARKQMAFQLKISCLLLALPLMLAGPARAQQDGPAPGYQPGQGVALGSSGVSIGGYASAQWQSLDRDDRAASLSHASLFVWSELGSHAKFLAELDNQDNHPGQRERERDGGRFTSVERVYLDYIFSDTLTLRAGKFLTPIGRWNLIHADPLVWTTSRPMLTHDLFPDNVTGWMAMGIANVDGHAVEYNVYRSAGGDVRRDPAQDAFDDAYGARVMLPVSDTLQLGMSVARFDQARPAFADTGGATERLLGLDFLWFVRDCELSGEWLRRGSSQGPAHAARGGFVQAAVPLAGAVSAVTRIEAIRNPLQPEQRRRAVLGLHFRASRALALKIEGVRDFNRNGTAGGVLASLSVLF